MLERKIYDSYAFTLDENEKRDINWEIYLELMRKYKVCCNEIPRLDDYYDCYDVVIRRTPGYHHSVCRVIRNRPELAVPELALLCGHGCLCFGYTLEHNGDIYVFED